MDSQEFLNECNRFMVFKGYVDADNIWHLSDDLDSLINLYKMHAIYFTTSQMLVLQTFVTSKVRRLFLDLGEIGNDNNLAEESEDYKETDFRELMSKNQIQQSIQDQFNKLQEIINPIDE